MELQMDHSASVGDDARRAPGAAAGRAATRPVGVWLLVCCVALLALVVVGGVTRLTHSGLSIVEWQPIIGTLPPLSEAQWQETFAKYQLTPEYQKVNKGMSLAEFKGIFWWEYGHRLLARSLGAIFLLPLVWFAIRRRIDRGLAWKLAGIFLLGAAQGAMGWFMVKSGLVDNPRVSHLRLTAHLGLAFAIYAAMFWLALGLIRPGSTGRVSGSDRNLVRLAWVIAAVTFAQVLSGGLVAGIRAGFAYNTFPLMADAVIPPGIMMIDPWYANFVNNVATIQFTHRAIAWGLLFLIGGLWWKVRGATVDGRAPVAVNLLALAILTQFALGVATLVLMVPLPLAAAHQGGALLLLSAALYALHALRYPAAR